MGIKETPDGRGTTSAIGVARRWAARAVLCTSVAAFALAVFPALAGAVTLAPFLGPVTATPGTTSATLNATIYPYGADTHYHFEYGPTISYGTKVPVPDGDAGAAAFPTTVTEMQAITGLSPNTTYHYRLVASNEVGPATGPEAADKTFTTTGTPPVVVADPATSIVGGFKLSGTVNPEGTATTYHFEYGISTTYGTSIPVPDGSVGSASADVPVSQEITGLLPNTTYHFRLSAQNGGPAVTTADRTFTTPPSGPAPPSIAVSAPVATPSGFELKAEVNPNGVDTHYHFEFGTTTAYGTNVPVLPGVDIGAGEVSVAANQNITGLQPNTTYHYRLVASNAEGSATGPEAADKTVTTLPEPPVVVATPFTESMAGWSLNGTVNANGAATTYHFQFGITTAYGSSIPATDVGVGSGTTPVSVTQLVASLPPGVPYHYRLVAHNAGGTSTSNDEAFITPAAASTPPTTTTQPPSLLSPPTLAPASTAPTSKLAPPSNRFTVRPPVAKGGSVTIQVEVPGAGTVSAVGKGLKTVTARAKKAGVVTLKLALTGAAATQLKKAPGHKLTVKVKIGFRPNGGEVGPATSKSVTFRLGGA
jgi:trimeric autotransporter adhesin